MIVVSDTTPINYLILIECETILPKLLSQVVVPEEVLIEMQNYRAPKAVRFWALSPPNWVLSKRAHILEVISGLGAGENAAINLALEIGADAVLTDDRRGIREATTRVHSLPSRCLNGRLK